MNYQLGWFSEGQGKIQLTIWNTWEIHQFHKDVDLKVPPSLKLYQQSEPQLCVSYSLPDLCILLVCMISCNCGKSYYKFVLLASSRAYPLTKNFLLASRCRWVVTEKHTIKSLTRTRPSFQFVANIVNYKIEVYGSPTERTWSSRCWILQLTTAMVWQNFDGHWVWSNRLSGMMWCRVCSKGWQPMR
jgi:hypothetical protein